MEGINRKVFAQPDRAEVQDRVIRAVEAHPEAFIAAYKASPDTYGGRYISADAFKETFEPFRQSPEARNRYNAVVHNAAAVLASEQYRRAIADNSDPSRDMVLFLTGVPGAGKTSVVMKEGFPPDCRAVFEGQLSRPEPAFDKIQLALDAGLKPHVVAVHVTPEVALRRTFTRFEEYGRGASIAVMAEIQSGLPDGLRRIHERFGDAVGLTVLDNRIPAQHKELEGWQHRKQLTQEGNHERIAQRLRAELDRHRAEGRISEACYRQANGDAPLGPSQAMVQAGHRRDQSNGDGREGPQGSGQAADVIHGEGAERTAALTDRPSNRPMRAVAFEQMTQAEALAKHPELMGAYRELAAQCEAIAQQHADAATRDRALTLVKSDIQRRLDDGRIPPLPRAQGRQHSEPERGP